MDREDRYSEEPDEIIVEEPYAGSDVELADVDEYALSDSETDMPYVGTNGLANCVGVALYDPENNAGAVSHLIPFMENLKPEEDELVKDMLSDLEETYDSESVYASIITSDHPSQDKLNQVNYTLEQSDLVEGEVDWIKMWDDGGDDPLGSVALDTCNGDLSPLPYSDIEIFDETSS